MKNRTPAPPNGGQPIDFVPATRRSSRHDAWTPERQRSFIEALADTGNVRRAAAMVNMSPEGAYYLRRQPEAASFAAAWSAALDHGVQRMKDIAFERAVEGELVPILAGGKLIGYRRRYNDRLLMFCLRHYGQDAGGKRTTINYFSTKAVAGAATSSPSPLAGEGGTQAEGEGGRGGAIAEASTTTVRTSITGPDNALENALTEAAALIHNFDGIELDAEAKAEIARVLDQCAARRRAETGTPADPAEKFFAAEQPERDILVYDEGYSKPRRIRARPAPASDNIVQPDAFLEQATRQEVDEDDQFRSSGAEVSWEMLDQSDELDRIDAAVAAITESNSESTEAKATDGGADALT